ncbi:MAG TPA: helix-turn-helix transcriptional regulator [Acidimicrobiales bacterium]|jgi:DNA-binding CsgD family transcriptional regulator|nr:helix-turn-helix transcriptional regulator [Acidimicrobiales bacterium]
MPRLSHRDLTGVLSLVRSVGEARDPDEFLAVTLKGVIGLVPCDVATVNEVNPHRDRVAYWMEPESFVVPDDAPALLARLAGDHPVISHMAATGDGSAQRISDFWTLEQFHASRIYELLYRPMGVEHQMAVGLPIPRPAVLGLVVNRSTPDFSERDVTVMNAVRPYLAQRWRSAQDQERLRTMIATAGTVMAEQGTGVIVLWDPPEELTPGGLGLLRRYFGGPARSSPLPGRVQAWVESHRSRRDDLVLDQPLTAQIDGHRAILRYVRAQAGRPDALVVSVEPVDTPPRSIEALGLTAREADVARLVLTGATNGQIAERLGVAPATVKKHLDNIYAKLGVGGRRQLTAIVLGITAE